jgi:hypothetical protein
MKIPFTLFTVLVQFTSVRMQLRQNMQKNCFWHSCLPSFKAKGMSVSNSVCIGDVKFSCGFSLTGRRLLVDRIKYMVAIQHYLCNAGKQGDVSFLYGIICVPFQSFSSVCIYIWTFNVSLKFVMAVCIFICFIFYVSHHYSWYLEVRSGINRLIHCIWYNNL